jgi:hypothetical protein
MGVSKRLAASARGNERVKWAVSTSVGSELAAEVEALPRVEPLPGQGVLPLEKEKLKKVKKVKEEVKPPAFLPCFEPDDIYRKRKKWRVK